MSFAIRIAAVLFLAQLTVGASVQLYESSEATLGWKKAKKPEPTKPPPNPMEVKLGRKLTPNEYQKWLRAVPSNSPGRKAVPHVMSPQEFKTWQYKRVTKPQKKKVPLNETKVVVSFRKTQTAMKDGYHSFVEDKFKPAIANAKLERARQHEEHLQWKAEEAEKVRRWEAMRDADLAKDKHEKEVWAGLKQNRKKRILDKEKRVETYLEQEEKKVYDKIKAQYDNMREEARNEKRFEKAKLYAEYHYVKAPAGEECPKGWTPVLNQTACQLAHASIGGNDMTSWNHMMSNRPGGCFVHIQNGDVNFNTAIGKLNDEDERICTRDRRANGLELKNLYKKVVQKEMEREAEIKEKYGEKLDVTRLAQARNQNTLQVADN